MPFSLCQDRNYWVGISPGRGLLGGNHVDLYATVLGAAFLGAVISDGVVERKPLCGDAVGAYAFGLQILGDLVGAPGRNHLICFVGTDIIGVAVDSDAALGQVGDTLDQFVERRFGFITDCRLVEAEQDPAKANPFEYAVKARKYIKEKAGL